MADMNLMNLYQDKLQDIQDFWDQYVAMIKVCDELDLHFGRCKSDARTILKKGQREPTAEHLKKAMDEIEEEHRAILFLYKADRQRYIKMIEQFLNWCMILYPSSFVILASKNSLKNLSC